MMHRRYKQQNGLARNRSSADTVKVETENTRGNHSPNTGDLKRNSSGFENSVFYSNMYPVQKEDVLGETHNLNESMHMSVSKESTLKHPAMVVTAP